MLSIGHVRLLTIVYFSVFSCALPTGHHKDNFTDATSLGNRELRVRLKLPSDAVPLPSDPSLPVVSLTSSAATATETAAQCPAPATPVSKRASNTVTRALNRVRILLTRQDDSEFIGLHGTNSKTAEFWETQGFISKPPDAPTAGLFNDFISGFASLLAGVVVNPTPGDGSSGADHELGVGLYVTDDRFTATNFAETNSKRNEGTTAKVCGIFAKSKEEWRTSITKVLIPKRLNKDFSDATKSTAFEKARLNYIGKVVPGIASPESAVKFGNLQLRSSEAQTGEMLIPSSLTTKFFARCVDSGGDQLPPGADSFPAFTYVGDTLVSEWSIVKKDDRIAQCVTIEEKLNVLLDQPLPGEDQ